MGTNPRGVRSVQRYLQTIIILEYAHNVDIKETNSNEIEKLLKWTIFYKS